MLRKALQSAVAHGGHSSSIAQRRALHTSRPALAKILCADSIDPVRLTTCACVYIPAVPCVCLCVYLSSISLLCHVRRAPRQVDDERV